MRKLKRAETVELRNELKWATERFAANRGSLTSVHHGIERIAKQLAGSKKTLGQARCSVRSLVAAHSPRLLTETGLPGWSFDDLYRQVTNARNDLAHSGTSVSLAGTRTLALAYVLMGALRSSGGCETAAHYMVSNPVCAQAWQTLADLRRTMLMHDYSALPLKERDGKSGREWKLLCARDLGVYLAGDSREERLAETVEKSELKRRKVRTVKPCMPIEKIARRLPVLVTEDGRPDGRLIGIVTPFDLL